MNARTMIGSATLLGSLVSAITLASVAHAANPVPVAQPAGAEKCYGVALAGKNDCAAGAGASCGGASVIDYDAHAFKYVPKGTCEAIVTPRGHGSVTQG